MKRRMRDWYTGLLLMLAACAPGCAGQQMPDASRAVVELERVRTFLVAACMEPPAMPREQCDEAVAAFNAIVGEP